MEMLHRLYLGLKHKLEGWGGSSGKRVLATHVTSGGMIIHQDYTLINLKY